jgi:hypothetical protein
MFADLWTTQAGSEMIGSRMGLYRPCLHGLEGAAEVSVLLRSPPSEPKSFIISGI